MSEREEPPGVLHRAVNRARDDAERARREGTPSLARTLAMVGSLGWLVVVPTVLGMFAGRWLDTRLGTGITLTAALLLLGLVFGCSLAWKRMHAE